MKLFFEIFSFILDNYQKRIDNETIENGMNIA